MRQKFIKRGLIFTLLLTLIFSSTSFAFADTTKGWKIVGSMSECKDEFTSAVVNGKIYAIGPSCIEEFDPVTNIWTKKIDFQDKINIKFVRDATVSLINNKIYFIFGQYTTYLYEYDPAENTITKRASPKITRAGAPSAVIDGKIYSIGGFTSDYKATNAVEVYDPATDTWTSKAPMNTNRYEFRIEVLDGKIYAMGGALDKQTCTSSVEVYDPKTDTWTPKSSMKCAIASFESEIINGKIYVFGGWNIRGSSSVEEYNPKDDVWTSDTSMNSSRFDFRVLSINGKIYAVGGDGGYDAPADFHSTAEEFDPVANKWTNLPSLSCRRVRSEAQVIGNTIYVFGGYNTTSKDTEAYDVGASAPTLTVTASPNKVKVGQQFTTMVAVHNGTNICAEDIQVKYDPDLFNYEGIQAETGLKIYKEDKSTPGVLRFIVASEGKDNAATGDKNLFHLTFSAKKAGTGKVDITKGRIADNATLETDVSDANCGEDTITVEGSKDVNRTGEFTLLDLGIDAWYNGMNASDTDSTKYDADVVADGKIDDNDLAEITTQILGNSNYAPNSYK